MAKAKFKIGMMIQVKATDTLDAGIYQIQEIVTGKSGYRYNVGSSEAVAFHSVREEDVICAFRPVKERKVKAAKTAKAPKKQKLVSEAEHRAATN